MHRCIRCHEDFGPGVFCRECGVHKRRRVVKARRSRTIGGKRGRNSGTTNKAKNKNK